MKRFYSVNLPIFLVIFVAFILFEGTQSAVIELENTSNKIETVNLDSKAVSYVEDVSDQHFYVSKDELSWFSANYFCKSKGWRLVSIRNLEEAVELFGFLQFNRLTVSRYWTSGNRLADQKSWYWNLHDEAMGYTNWAQYYPESGKTQFCMQITGMLWYSYDCEKISRYICAKN
ncbi:lithostathine-2 [Zeugodacus cucurbitae]|uniref:lithostathine-2 n=1 Tax=Zeugodacus cucurbitae TaxID=28588 RepID=UPI0005967ECE|nr:lithostathine-2 [Zeugodacus cucurbitae]